MGFRRWGVAATAVLLLTSCGAGAGDEQTEIPIMTAPASTTADDTEGGGDNVSGAAATGYGVLWHANGELALSAVGASGQVLELQTWKEDDQADPALPTELDDLLPDLSKALYRRVRPRTEQIAVTVHDDRRDRTKAFDLPTGLDDIRVGLTRPTGENVFVSRASAGQARLERRTPDGDERGVVWSGPAPAAGGPLHWLHTPNGTEVVVGGGDGLHLVANDDGKIVRTLPVAPAMKDCRPVRWWEQGRFLATCTQVDSYHALFVVPVDGTPATRLSPDDYTRQVVDFGYVDAYRYPDGTMFLQWTGDCGAAEVRRLGADGKVTKVLVPLSAGADRIVGTAPKGRIAVFSTTGCDGEGWFGFVDTENPTTTRVVPEGVVSVVAGR